MTLIPVCVREESADDLEFAINAHLAPLLTNRIFGVEIDQSKPGPYFTKNLYCAFTYTTGETAIPTPFRIKTFSSYDEDQVTQLIQEFINDNPTYFFSEVYFFYRTQSPNPDQGVSAGIFYNETASAFDHWGPAGSGGGDSFVNPDPTTATVGGIPAGSTFPVPQSMQAMWDRLLYPYQAPAFTSLAIQGQSSPFEVGYSIPASVTFTWSISHPANVGVNSLDIVDVTGGNTTLASGLANDGSEPVVMAGPIALNVAGSYQFKMDGVNTQAAPFTSTLTLSWRWRLFYGVDVNPTLNGLMIGALAGSALVTSYAGVYACAAGGYKYICQADAAGGQLNSVKDQSTGFNVPMAIVTDDPAYSNVDGGGFSYALVSYTNAQGVTTNYRVYRTANFLGGAITLVVT